MTHLSKYSPCIYSYWSTPKFWVLSACLCCFTFKDKAVTSCINSVISTWLDAAVEVRTPSSGEFVITGSVWGWVHHVFCKSNTFHDFSISVRKDKENERCFFVTIDKYWKKNVAVETFIVEPQINRERWNYLKVLQRNTAFTLKIINSGAWN